MALGNYEAAFADFSAALSWNGNDAESLYYRGMVYETQGDAPSAINDYTQAIAVYENPEIYPQLNDQQLTFVSDMRARIGALGGQVP